jgi:hypothetical protein
MAGWESIKKAEKALFISFLRFSAIPAIIYQHILKLMIM